MIDESDQPIDGATVRIHALQGSTQNDVSVPVVGGKWASNEIPWGPVEFVASRPGWTTRHRLRAFDTLDSDTVDISFGILEGAYKPAKGASGTVGAALFLSDYPEVERVETANGTFEFNPNDGVPEVDPTNVVLKIVFSETLNEPTRQRLASAIRLWPADGASGNPDAIDLAHFADTDQGDGLAGLNIDFGPDSNSTATRGAIGPGAGGRALTKWEMDGRTLTFAIDGSLNSTAGDVRYQIGLVSDGAAYEDETGHALGTNSSGLRDVPPPTGQLIANAFCKQQGELQMLWERPDQRPTSASQRWNATHTASFGFRVRHSH